MYRNNIDLLTKGKYLGIGLILITITVPSYSQEQRLTDHNTIAWLVYTGTFNIRPKLAIYTEYQWRRVDGFRNWQQGLLRGGINFALRKDITLNAGYAFAETFPYGDYAASIDFPEHRIFEQVVIKNPIGKVEISHRFTLEQRFVGRVTMDNARKLIDWFYLNRMRYRIKTEIPISNKGSDKKRWSLIFQDEIFIGWGENIGTNVFDQNRLALLVGYKLNQQVKLEAGYLSQILQQGKRVNDKPVFQYNRGFMIASHLSFDLVK